MDNNGYRTGQRIVFRCSDDVRHATVIDFPEGKSRSSEEMVYCMEDGRTDPKDWVGFNQNFVTPEIIVTYKLLRGPMVRSYPSYG